MEQQNSSCPAKREIQRPLAIFPANIWKNAFTSFSNSNAEYERNKRRVEELKEKVRELLIASKANPLENIKFINLLCRLGVSYHFESEIEERLEQIFGSCDFYDTIRANECDVDTVGVVFQVFRQFGFKLSSDVFDKFKKEDGTFKEVIGADDARGILSLYEAAQWSTRGEDTLDEALAFSTLRLKGRLACQSSPHLALCIKNALKHPYHKGIVRVETKQYISYYEEEESHNEILLEFAKLDFNLLQLLHREELALLSRWSEDLEVASKFPYARIRIVESYVWACSAYFEPQYSRARIILSKILFLETILDDTYDAYGTLDELNLFTDAIDRWHPGAAAGLPDCMKDLYQIILDFCDEVEEDLSKEGRSECIYYAKDAWKRIAKCYYQGAKWLHEGYVATFEEYVEKRSFSMGGYLAAVGSFLGMTDVANVDAFEYFSTLPKLATASDTAARLMNDIVSYELEHKRDHVDTAIDCYMKQYGVSKEKAIIEIQKVIADSWKDMNETLMRPHPISFSLLIRVFNILRGVDVFYKDQDMFTNPEFLKEHVVSVFMEQIPV